MSALWRVGLAGLLWATAISASEVAVQYLPLAGPSAARTAEFSGLVWHGEVLVLLPQFPQGSVMALDKAAICAAIDASAPAALTPAAMPFSDGGLSGMLPGFAGYEALVISGDRVYVAVETESFDCTMGAWLVAGRIDTAIVLDPATRIEVPLSAQRCNMAIEALTLHGDRLYALEEASGRRVSASPKAHVYGLDLRPLATMGAPALEYRLTDATQPDAAGVFWVSNYLWPGDVRKLDPAPEPEFAIPAGGTHAQLPQVERLVALRVDGEGIVCAARPPIWLTLEAAAGRNWEGIARLDQRGFLLVTDAHPQTLFGFVPVHLE